MRKKIACVLDTTGMYHTISPERTFFFFERPIFDGRLSSTLGVFGPARRDMIFWYLLHSLY